MLSFVKLVCFSVTPSRLLHTSLLGLNEISAHFVHGPDSIGLILARILTKKSALDGKLKRMYCMYELLEWMYVLIASNLGVFAQKLAPAFTQDF